MLNFIILFCIWHIYTMHIKNFFLQFYGYHGKIFWGFLCILFMVIILSIYVYIVMGDYLCVYIVMDDYLCLFLINV